MFTNTSIKQGMTFMLFSLYDQTLRCLSKHVGYVNDESLYSFFFSMLNKNERQKWNYRLLGEVCSARALCVCASEYMW